MPPATRSPFTPQSPGPGVAGSGDLAVKIQRLAQRPVGHRRVADRGGEAAAEFQDARR
jgi:hypothetical protein